MGSDRAWSLGAAALPVCGICSFPVSEFSLPLYAPFRLGAALVRFGLYVLSCHSMFACIYTLASASAFTLLSLACLLALPNYRWLNMLGTIISMLIDGWCLQTCTLVNPEAQENQKGPVYYPDISTNLILALKPAVPRDFLVRNGDRR